MLSWVFLLDPFFWREYTYKPVLKLHRTNLETNIAVDITVVHYARPPSDVVKFVQSLTPEKRVVTGLSADRVLDREIYERSII